MHERLVAGLIKEQAEHLWSDADLAAEIGISPSYWSFIRRGMRQFTVPVLRRIADRFPHLKDECSLFLQSKLTDSHDALTTRRGA